MLPILAHARSAGGRRGRRLAAPAGGYRVGADRRSTMRGPETKSLWLDADADASIDSPVPAEVDVVVVGAGLAGLCTALLCVQDGASVAVLEAGQVGGRTTGHSTAKL